MDRRLSKDELLTYNYVLGVALTITAQIGGVLKTPRPPGAEIDLSSMLFYYGDWKGIDFDGANLDGIWFSAMDLQDAELKGVIKFNGAHFTSTAWWKARSINKLLLEYLRTNYPFSAEQLYGPRREPSSQQEYETAINRLTSNRE
jgi:hypothetical protein